MDKYDKDPDLKGIYMLRGVNAVQDHTLIELLLFRPPGGLGVIAVELV